MSSKYEPDMFPVEEEINKLMSAHSVARLPVTADPETLGGAPVFTGTRVPVATLLDNLADGITLDEFLDNFPTVSREQAVQVLDFYKETLARLGRAA